MLWESLSSDSTSQDMVSNKFPYTHLIGPKLLHVAQQGSFQICGNRLKESWATAMLTITADDVSTLLKGYQAMGRTVLLLPGKGASIKPANLSSWIMSGFLDMAGSLFRNLGNSCIAVLYTQLPDVMSGLGWNSHDAKTCPLLVIFRLALPMELVKRPWRGMWGFLHKAGAFFQRLGHVWITAELASSASLLIKFPDVV